MLKKLKCDKIKVYITSQNMQFKVNFYKIYFNFLTL